MKNRKIIGLVAGVIAVIAIVIVVVLSVTRKEPVSKQENIPTPVATATTVSTEVPVSPTEEPEVTVTPEPTETATPEPTVTNTPVPTSVPTEEPTATPEPPSPLPTATSTPVPTNTPVPTATSTPTPVVAEGTKPEYRVQMGDNVWYEYYMDENTLIVTGEGATWDFKEFSDYTKCLKEATQVDWNEDLACKVYTIIIGNGITRIGNYALAYMTSTSKVILASSLKEVGDRSFLRVGFASEHTEWIGLDLYKLVAETTSFYKANLPSNVDGSAVQCTPTPTPIITPTPTPIPDPNNPRLLHTQGMGNNVDYEFLDTGYIYAKGSGNIKDLPDMYMWPQLPEGTLSIIDYYVAEEGITGLGNWCIPAAVNEIWLPKTLKSIDEWTNNYIGKGETLHWYYEGKAVTIVANNLPVELSYVYDCLTGEKSTEEYSLTIIWE